MRLLFIPRPQALFDELVDCLAEAVDRLFVVLLDRVDDAVLDMILQNDLADVVDGGADRRNLNQNLRAVAPILDHLPDRFQMSDGARQPVDHRLRVRVDVPVRARLMRMVVIMIVRMRMVVFVRLLGRVDVLRRVQVGNVMFVQIFVVVFHGASSLQACLILRVYHIFIVNSIQNRQKISGNLRANPAPGDYFPDFMLFTNRAGPSIMKAIDKID